MTVDELRDRLLHVPGDHKVLVALTPDAYDSVDVLELKRMHLSESIPEGDYDLTEAWDGSDNAVVIFPDGLK